MKSEQLAIDGGQPVHPGVPIPLTRVCWDDQEQRAVQRVFESGFFCSAFEQADEVRALEEEFARQVGARCAVAFSSGTTAQHASLVALGIGPGDEVIVPPLTFISTAYTVLLAGAVPVFADVCRDTITIDPEDIERKITSRTKAIVPVHWLGHPADMAVIGSLAASRDLIVIEDCAHGPGIALNGQPVGGFGAISCWSLQQSKILTAAGEGGVATTQDEVLADRLRQVCDHGKDKSGTRSAGTTASYRVTGLGNNYRLSEIQAAFARAQLRKLDRFLERRREACAALRDRLSQIPGLEFRQPRAGAELSHYTLPVLFPRESFAAPLERIDAAMHAEGVGTLPIALTELCHIHPLFAEAAVRSKVNAYRLREGATDPPYGWRTLPVAEKIAGELLLLPLHPGLSEQDLDDIVEASGKVASAYRR